MHWMVCKLGKCVLFFDRVKKYFIRKTQLYSFESAGKNVYISEDCRFTERNISVGDDVFIGANCCFQSVHGHITIGNHVLFGPSVHIHGGNHEYHQVGKLMKECTKEKDSDGCVVIEDDCWIGAYAIILKGVTIGRGSVIGAGAVVSKDIPPFSIYTGIPPRRCRQRFTEEELKQHMVKMYERKLYI